MSTNRGLPTGPPGRRIAPSHRAITEDRPYAPVEARGTTMYGTIGLRDDPFPRDPLAGSYVAVTPHERILSLLREWFTATEDAAAGLAVVSGEPGSGKTRLLEQLTRILADGPDRLIGIVPDDGSRRSDAQLLRASITALGGTAAGRTGLELTTELKAIIAGHDDDPMPPALLIDNAALTGSQLEIMRNILAPDPQDATETRIQVVLFGPPELPDRISRRRSLAGYVRHAAAIAPFDSAEMTALLDARLDAVREDEDRSPQILGEANDILWTAAAGNPGLGIALAHSAVRELIATGSTVVDAGLARTVTAAWDNQERRAGEDEESVIQTRLAFPGFDEPATPARSRRRQQ